MLTFKYEINVVTTHNPSPHQKMIEDQKIKFAARLRDLISKIPVTTFVEYMNQPNYKHEIKIRQKISGIAKQISYLSTVHSSHSAVKIKKIESKIQQLENDITFMLLSN